MSHEQWITVLAVFAIFGWGVVIFMFLYARHWSIMAEIERQGRAIDCADLAKARKTIKSHEDRWVQVEEACENIRSAIPKRCPE